jgi:hypothetical protein
MKPGKTIWIILFTGILLLTAGIDLGSSIAKKTSEMNGSVSMGKVVVTIKNQLNSQNGNAFLQNEITEIEKQLNSYTAYTAHSGLISNTVHAGNTSYSARVTGTNWRFPEFNNLIFKYGGYFVQKTEDEGIACAIIDEALAWNIFKTENVAGKFIEIYNTPFKIIGIVKKSESVGEYLADNGIPEVFIPVQKMLELDSTAKIDSLQIKTGDIDTLDKNESDVTNALMHSGKIPSNYNITDYNIKNTQLKQKPMFLEFFTGFAAMLVLAGLLIKAVIYMVQLIKDGCRNDYFSNVIKSNSGIFSSAVIKILLLLACILVLWFLTSFRPYIPPEYIPDNLTDLEYFASLFKANIHSSIAGLGFIPSRTELLTGTMESLSKWVFYIPLFAGSTFIYLGFYMMKACKVGKVKVAVCCGSFLLTSVILVSVMALWLGLPPVVDFKGVTVFWAFIFIVIYKNESNEIYNTTNKLLIQKGT